MKHKQLIGSGGHFETIHGADIAMGSKYLPNQEFWSDAMA